MSAGELLTSKTMTYADFQRLVDEYTDHIMSAAIRHERARPAQDQLEAQVAAVKAKDALWDAVRVIAAENQALRNLAHNLRPGPISEAFLGPSDETCDALDAARFRKYFAGKPFAKPWTLDEWRQYVDAQNGPAEKANEPPRCEKCQGWHHPLTSCSSSNGSV